MYFFSPPLSAEGGPYEEENAASEGPDGLLWQADGVEDKCQYDADAHHGEYAERFGGDFHRYIIFLGNYMHVNIKYLLAFSRNLIHLIYRLVATLFFEVLRNGLQPLPVSGTTDTVPLNLK